MKRAEALQILGLEGESSAEEIKKAYKEKARQYHPDKIQQDNPDASLDEAAEQFKRLGEAYTTLTVQSPRPQIP